MRGLLQAYANGTRVAVFLCYMVCVQSNCFTESLVGRSGPVSIVGPIFSPPLAGRLKQMIDGGSNDCKRRCKYPFC